MSDERDPRLVELFADAGRVTPSAEFTQQVMQRLVRERRRTIVFWGVAAALGIAFAANIADPLFSMIDLTSQLLPTPIVEIETDWLQALLSPVNSIAAAAAVAIFGVRLFWRRISN